MGLSDADVGLADPQQAAPQMLPGARQPLPPQATPNIGKQTGQVGLSDEEVGLGQQQQPAPQNSLAGAGSALGHGLLKGAAGLIGAPGDITNFAARALGYGDDYGKTWGSESAKEGIEKSFGVDRNYEPQTALERGVQKVGEFLPAMAIPGGGDIGLGMKLLTAVGFPALGSFAGEELTRGTPYEPYASIAGGIGGGIAGSRIANALAARNVAAANPMQNAQQLGTAATNVYQSPELNALRFRPDAISDLQNTMRQAVGNRDPSLANGTHAIINSLTQPGISADPMSALTGVTPRQPPPVPWSDVHNARTLLGQQAGKFADPIDQSAAVAAKRALDTWLENVPQSSLHAGDTSEIQNFFRANTNYQVMSALNKLEGREYAAELGAAAANSGANFENAMRQRIKGILVSPAQRSQFESLPNGDEVIQAMEKVVRGGTVDNLVRALSNIVGGGGGMHAGLLGIGGAMLGHPEAALAPLAGWGLKAARNRSVNNQLNNITSLIQQGAPANQASVAARNALQQRLQQMNPAQRALVNAALARNQLLTPQPQSQ